MKIIENHSFIEANVEVGGGNEGWVWAGFGFWDFLGDFLRKKKQERRGGSFVPPGVGSFPSWCICCIYREIG